MRKISSYEIALSAMACALATVFLTIGIYSELLLFTAYLVACIALMLPLAKQSYIGYFLAYIGTCLLALLFNAARFFDVLPFIMFFGLHPFVNEMQLKIKINRWVACAVKALWFDITMYLIYRFVFGMTTNFPLIDKYMIPIILIFGSAFFVFYDYTAYRCRGMVNDFVKRINKRK